MEVAVDYRAKFRLRSKTFIYSVTRFGRLVGKEYTAGGITASLIADFREEAISAGLSPKTIENTVTDICTLVRWETGRTIDCGRRLKKKRPVPEPAPLDDISAVHQIAPDWLKAYIELSVWTGLRLSDAIELTLCSEPDRLSTELRWTASKTGINHVFPPATFRPTIVSSDRLPLTDSAFNNVKRVRDALSGCCKSANVKRFTPKHLRQRAVTSWSQANGQAGAILHGSGLGILSHYVEPLAVLQAAACQVQLPSSFDRIETEKSAEQHMIRTYRRLTPEKKTLVVDITQGMLD